MMPLKIALRGRLKHFIGRCQVLSGYTESPTGAYTPMSLCWICGRDFPEFYLSFREIRDLVSATEQSASRRV